ncbi:MAG: prolipoprotein diacylglyceryl transferase [Rickettsiales bacterium]|nr:prolipoprotein diacylglyceryl transferase [Rickettsiales bacterium]
MVLIAELLAFPAIDPVALQLGPLAIRWYSLAYMGGILLGWLYVRWLDQRVAQTTLLTAHHYDDLITWAIAGVILGGRLGYVVFYQPAHYWANPQDILQLWHGGMSFHGGALGVIIAFYIYARRRGLSYVPLMDRLCCAVPIGLFFGRLANFVNGELYGRITDNAWGMIFPRGGDLPRHPSQLYEAALEGAVLWLLLFVVARRTHFRQRGLCSGLFLLGYGIARFVVEFVREPDAYLGFVAGIFSMGQLLCLPMILIGGALVMRALVRREEMA